MNKVFKKAILPAAALLLAVAAAVILFWNLDQSGNSSEHTVLLDVPLKDIQFVSVENGNGAYRLINDGQGNFTVENQGDVPLDTEKLTKTVDLFASLRASRLPEGTKVPFSRSTCTVTVSVRNQEHRYTLLYADTENEGVYLTDDSRDELFWGVADLAALMDSTADSYINLQLTPGVTEEDMLKISLISISGNDRDEEITVQRNDPEPPALAGSTVTYSVTSPTVYNVSQKILEETVLRPITLLAASGVASHDTGDGSLKSHGLDQPSYVLNYQIDGTPHTVYFGSITQDAMFYARVEGISLIYQVPVSSAVFLQTRLPDIVSREVITAPIDSFAYLTIETETQSYRFDASGTGDNLKIMSDTTEIDAENFQKFYTVLLDIMIEGDAVEPQDVLPVAKVTIAYRNSNKTDVVEYIPMEDSRRCFVRYNGSGFFYVMSKDVTAMVAAAERLTIGDVVQTQS